MSNGSLDHALFLISNCTALADVPGKVNSAIF